MALHVFNDHDGVVNDEAGCERDAEEREGVDGKAEDLDEGEGADQRDGNGDGGDKGGAPVLQEEEDDHDHDDDGFHQRGDDLLDRLADDSRGVDGDGVLQAWREGLLELLENSAAAFINVKCVGVRELLDAYADGIAARELELGVVVFGADLRVADIAKEHNAAARRRVLEDDVFELAGLGEAADDTHGHLEGLLGVRGGLTKLPGSDFDVLLAERV